MASCQWYTFGILELCGILVNNCTTNEWQEAGKNAFKSHLGLQAIWMASGAVAAYKIRLSFVIGLSDYKEHKTFAPSFIQQPQSVSESEREREIERESESECEIESFTSYTETRTWQELCLKYLTRCSRLKQSSKWRLWFVAFDESCTQANQKFASIICCCFWCEVHLISPVIFLSLSLCLSLTLSLSW